MRRMKIKQIAIIEIGYVSSTSKIPMTMLSNCRKEEGDDGDDGMLWLDNKILCCDEEVVVVLRIGFEALEIVWILDCDMEIAVCCCVLESDDERIRIL